LDKLVNYRDIVEQIEHFQDNAIYQEILGKQFKGINTNWHNLERHILWCKEFGESIGSFAVARSVVSDHKDIKEYIIVLSKSLSEALYYLGQLETYSKIKIDFSVSIYAVINELERCVEELQKNMDLLNDSKLNNDYVVKIKNKRYTVLRDATGYVEYAVRMQDEINNNHQYKKIFSDLYNGVNTNTDKLIINSNWVKTLKSVDLKNEDIYCWIINNVSNNHIKHIEIIKKKFESFLFKLNEIISELNKYGSVDINSWFVNEENKLYLDDILDKVINCRKSIHYLHSWADYCKIINKINDYGLREIQESINKRIIQPELAVHAYKSILYRTLARKLLKQYIILGEFNRISYENTIERFKKIDRDILMENTSLIASQLSKNKPPVGVGYGKVKDYTELSLIEREINKKKRHIPIRQLVRRASNALKALKPCFMMSPMSVAQYLPPGQIEFDLLIVDEASQVRPQDALGAIARTKQMIIVGDANQLPPTDFFIRSESEEEYEEEIAVSGTESILDLSITNFKKRRLRWHYRSEHEMLINYSNYEFYDGDLMIFPSPKGKHKDYGVKHHYINDAVYKNGKNYREAESVVEKIIEHYQKDPNLTLGVATFNIKQRDLISDLLERVTKKELWLDRLIKDTENIFEPFFIKNLENVQGDERDVIFISTTYGKDPDTGKVYQRFGPLGGDFGWRRLNVICTRARKRVELITSLRSSDIILGEQRNKGAIALKRYLEYVEHNGQLNDFGVISGREPESDFEISVGREIQKYGYEVVPQLGVAGFYIDLAVKHPHLPGEYILGIECDGATYHSSKSVRDRDRIRQDILEAKGWKIHRVWSTDWFKNRDKEIERLISLIEKLIEKDKQVIETTEHTEILTLSENTEFVEDENVKHYRDIVSHAIDTDINESRQTLEQLLLKYRSSNIDTRFQNKSNGILRNDMVKLFVKYMPTSLEDFHAKFPQNMRENTDTNQTQFLGDIFEIIENYEYSRS